MGGEWPTVSLGDIVEIFDGPHATPKKTEKGPIFLGISNLAAGRLDLSDVAHLSEKDFVRWTRRVTPRTGDVVFSYETRLGEAAIMPGDMRCCLGRRMGLLRAKSPQLDSRFLLYAYLGEEFQDVIRERTIHGSTVDRIPLTEMGTFPIRVPPLPEQRAIAHILGTLDDKIELNRRMNETLEGMARAVFKSWFVDFDPVIDNALAAGNPIPDRFRDRAAQRHEAAQRARHEGHPFGLPRHVSELFPAAFHDSELGEIPEGWEVKTVGDIAQNYDSKRIPLSGQERSKRQGPYPYYGAAGVLDHVEDSLFEGVYVLVGEDGSVVGKDDQPVLQYVWGKFWVNNHAHVLKGNGISQEHLYLLLQEVNIRPYVTGAVQPKLNQTNLNRIPAVVGTDGLTDQFSDLTTSLFASLRKRTEESRTLAALRDALLPKLLSGELRVKDAEGVVKRAL